MSTAPRYQQFLRETLQKGLVDLQNDPSLTEVIGIPRSSFEIFIRAFRHSLPDNIQKTLPPHDLTNKKYLQVLARQIEAVLQKPVQTERVLSNMPPLENLKRAYIISQQRQTKAVSQHHSWQQTFGQQIKQYNLDLLSRLDQQIQKEFPSLANNPAKRKILVADMARTIQDQGLRGIKGDYERQANDVLQEVTRRTIRQYASEIEELQIKTEEKINHAAQNVAVAETQNAFSLRRNQIQAETAPQNNPVYNIDSTIQVSVIINLPPELAQNEEVVKTIVGEIEAQIHQASGSEKNYQEILALTVRNVLKRKNVLVKIDQDFSASQQEKFANSVAEEVTPVVYRVATSSSFAQTPFAGGTIPTPGITQIIPPIPPPQILTPPINTAINIPAGSGVVQGPTASPIPGIGGAGASVVGYVAHGDPLELLQASGQPLHFLTALANPTSAIDFGKYLITAGPIRSAFWFTWESFGLAKPDYIKIGLFGLDRMQYDLSNSLKKFNNELNSATSDFEKYKLNLEIKEADSRLTFVNKIFEGIHNNPVLDGAYKAFFGEPGKFGGFGIYHLVHPWQAFTTRLYNNHILLGLGVDGIFGSLSAYAKYGGYGGAYVTQEYLKMFGVYLIKAAGAKIGLYGVYGQGLRRHYELKLLHEVKLFLQKGLSETAKTVVHTAAVQLSKTAVGKTIVAGITKLATWIGTRLGSLISGIASAIGIVLLVWDAIKLTWEIFKKFIKGAGFAIGALLLWLFSNFSPLEALLSVGGGLGGGFLTSTILGMTFGPWGILIGWVSGFLGGTFSTAMFFKNLHTIFDGLGSGLNSLSSLGSNLLSGLTHGTMSSLIGLVKPVLATTGLTIGVGYIYISYTTSASFWIPEQLPKVQSDYLRVQKTADFPGTLGQNIKYTLSIATKKADQKLINIKISDKTEATCKNTPPIISERTFSDKIPASIDNTGISFSYEVPTNNSFNDCLIVNTATVTADVENGPTGETSFAIASVTIGNPPVDNPGGWPLAKGCISQGPGGYYSHLVSGRKIEAIDIADPTGTPVVATHKGTVGLVNRNHPLFGNYVVLNGLGTNGPFSTLYAHLQTINVSVGRTVSKNAVIGASGNTGRSTAPHLHYEFTGLKMEQPYVPVFIPACSGDGPINCPNICW